MHLFWINSNVSTVSIGDISQKMCKTFLLCFFEFSAMMRGKCYKIMNCYHEKGNIMKQLQYFFKSLVMYSKKEDCARELSEANLAMFPILANLFHIATLILIGVEIRFLLMGHDYLLHGSYILLFCMSILLWATTASSLKKLGKDLNKNADTIVDSVERFTLIYTVLIAMIGLVYIYYTGSFLPFMIACAGLCFLYTRPGKVIPTYLLTCFLLYLLSAAFRGISTKQVLAIAEHFVLNFAIVTFILYKYQLKIELIHSRREARSATEKTIQTDLSKAKFLANVSHHLEESIHDSEEINSFVNNVSDLNRIESNNLQIIKQPASILKLAEELQQIFEPKCKEKNQKMIINILDIRHEYLYMDVVHLRSMLVNLLSNAIKYTPESGHIHFHICELEELSSDEVRFRFVIEDDGIGMTSEFVNRIFTPFTRAEDIILDDAYGTGIGMTIVKHIIDAMDGSIDVASLPNVGTEITVLLDFGIAPFPDEEEDTQSMAS